MQQIFDHTHTRFEVTNEAEGIRKALKARIAQHNADVQDIEAKSAEFRGVPAAEWDDKNEKAATKLRSRRREALSREVEIRSELNDWFDRVDTTERDLAAQSAHTAYMQSRDTVTAGLLALGYGEMQVERLTDQNPGVRAADDQRSQLSCTQSDAVRAINDKCLAECREALERLKAESVAGLSA